MNTLGDRVRIARERLNINQEELSNISGISRSNISRIESNKISPKSESIIALMQSLNVSSDWLLTGYETNESTQEEKKRNDAPDFNDLYDLYAALPITDKIDVFTYVKIRYSILKEDEMLSTLEHGDKAILKNDNIA